MNTLSPLLGIDKSNPLFELLVNPATPDEILVHYGMHLLERVHLTADSIEGKLLVGRLYNAKLKRKKLVEIFGWDLKTIRGYAEALRSGDSDRLRSVLSGQGAERKIGEKEERFVRETFREVHEEQGCHTNLFIRKQLFLKLGVEVSRETIRLLINKEKERLKCQIEEVTSEPGADRKDTTPLPLADSALLEEASESVDVSEQTALNATAFGESSEVKKKSVEAGLEQKISSESGIAGEDAPGASLDVTALDDLSLSVQVEMSPAPESAEDKGVNEAEDKGQTKGEKGEDRSLSSKDNSCNFTAVSNLNTDRNSRNSPCFIEALPKLNSNGESQFLFHGGLFMVLDSIFEIADNVDGEVSRQIRQWLASILCGAVNIEQSSELDLACLSVILGQKVLADDSQREYLHKHALTDAATQLRRANVQFTNAGLDDIFLYDPHGIKYTGIAKIIRGWLGASHEIAKAYYQDFIHTLDGCPMVAFLDDNRDDLLRRFPRYVEQFRQLLSGDRSRRLTFVVDRAIYSIENLRLYRDKYAIYVITWEKNCDNLQWTPKENDVGTFSFMKYRNHYNDTTTYRVEYYSEKWELDKSFTRYLVRIYKGDVKCEKVLSVICTDPHHINQVVLEPILRRWVQENNISYLINNVGMNEVTSYGKVDYADIAQTLEDREVTNPEIRKLCVEKMNLRQKLGVEMVKHSDRRRRLEVEQQELKGMKEKIDDLKTSDKKLENEFKRRQASLKGKIKRFDKATETLDRHQKTYEEEMARIEAKIKATPELLLRLEQLIEGAYQKLNFGPKSVMDAVRILAYTIFRKLHEEFRPIYNNYRNDHRILRELIRSPVVVSCKLDKINVQIIPTRRYAKKQRQRVNCFLRNLNQRAAKSQRTKPLHFSIYALPSRNSIGNF